jgi:hypothetical protein
MDTGDFETAFDWQVRACRIYASEIYARLMERCLEDLRAGGPVATLAARWTGPHPLQGLFPLRLAAAAHRLVLTGRAPDLARHYPTAGGAPRWPAAADLFIAVVAAHLDELGDQLERFPQTNEVARCGALLAAFLPLARLPLRLWELGASAGLNLNWDRYRFELGSFRWGPPASAVRIRAEAEGVPPEGPAHDAVLIESRAGCDLSPIDATSDEEAERLCSYVWPDQPQRLATLRGAIDVARRHPTRLTRADAADWLAEHLAADPPDGVQRVVYHSAVWPYLEEQVRRHIEEMLVRAGRRADARTPLAWVRLEHEGEPLTLRVRSWPGGVERRLAETHPHGLHVRWLGSG